MDANTVLHELTADVKDRINYLVYKDVCRKENITVRDLEIAYEYARVNVTMVEESQTPMLELFLLDRHRERILDMQIMELRNGLYPERDRPLSRAEVHRADAGCADKKIIEKWNRKPSHKRRFFYAKKSSLTFPY